jgi:thiosulfate dehydrogenase [quinone] large subunit
MIRNTTTFLLARLAVAVSLFGHGLVRLPKLNGFSNWMVKQFQASMLPKILVVPFSYVLPVAEFAIGLLLIAGLFTRQALVAGSIVMLLLIFGSCMIEEWDAIPTQLIHMLFFAVLLSYVNEYNSFAIDKRIKK